MSIDFPTVRERLGRLLDGGFLLGASGQAYADGLVGVIRVGPFGDVLGTSKLVKVRMLDPVTRSGRVAIPLRWEATGPMGRLFPVLDADLSLEPGEGETTRLGLTGAYRPPMGNVGEALDQVVLHHAATATVRSLLKRMADVLTEPADAGAAAAAAMDAPVATAPVATAPVADAPVADACGERRDAASY